MALPGLRPISSSVAPDVAVDFSGTFAPGETTAREALWYVNPQCRDGIPVLRVWQRDSGVHYRFYYQDGTEFLIEQHGSIIRGSWPSSLSLENATSYLLGPILGFVLRLRGMLCLHASAVMIGDEAIVFMGPAGSGKSTIAAMFAKLGYPVLTDDVVALREEEGGQGFTVLPGYPRLNLWSGEVKGLGGIFGELPRVDPQHPTWDKRYLDLRGNGLRFCNKPVRLAAVYTGEMVAGHKTLAVNDFLPTSRLVVLASNVYMNPVADRAMRAREFDSLSRLAMQVPVRRMLISEDRPSPTALCEAILADLEAMSRSAA